MMQIYNNVCIYNTLCVTNDHLNFVEFIYLFIFFLTSMNTAEYSFHLILVTRC